MTVHASEENLNAAIRELNPDFPHLSEEKINACDGNFEFNGVQIHVVLNEI